MQIEAYVNDGKGGCKKVLIDEPAEVKAAREQSEFLRTLTPKTISDLQTKLSTAEAELADAKARLAKLETAAETAEKA